MTEALIPPLGKEHSCLHVFRASIAAHELNGCGIQATSSAMPAFRQRAVPRLPDRNYTHSTGCWCGAVASCTSSAQASLLLAALLLLPLLQAFFFKYVCMVVCFFLFHA